jgi:hypothetical protein
MARLIITALFVVTATVIAQEPEGAWGTYPVPRIVGMSGECTPGFVLSRGQVNAAEHEWEIGSWNLGQLTVVMPVGAVSLLRVKELQGKDAELILRRLDQRTPDKVER